MRQSPKQVLRDRIRSTVSECLEPLDQNGYWDDAARPLDDQACDKIIAIVRRASRKSTRKKVRGDPSPETKDTTAF